MQKVAPRNILQFIFNFLCLLAVGPFAFAAPNWWNSNWSYRIPISVEPADAEIHHRAVAITINFSIALKNLKSRGVVVSNTLRLVEVGPNGAPIDESVPLQFDFAPDYHAAKKAEGTLSFLLKGSTTAARNYYLYFETNEAANLTELLTPYRLNDVLPPSEVTAALRPNDQVFVNLGVVETKPVQRVSRPRTVTIENLVRTSATTSELSATEPLWRSKPEHQFFAGYCTWYAARKWKEFTGGPVTWSGDGGRWFDNAAEEGRKVSDDPKAAVVGAIIVWTRRGSAGHVAFVEAVNEQGIFITEMNARGRYMISDAFLPFDNLDKGTKYKFKGYILPD